jgi:hypothetical protein
LDCLISAFGSLFFGSWSCSCLVFCFASLFWFLLLFWFSFFSVLRFSSKTTSSSGFSNFASQKVPFNCGHGSDSESESESDSSPAPSIRAFFKLENLGTVGNVRDTGIFPMFCVSPCSQDLFAEDNPAERLNHSAGLPQGWKISTLQFPKRPLSRGNAQQPSTKPTSVVAQRVGVPLTNPIHS